MASLPLFYTENFSSGSLDTEDSKHCARVLRLVTGDHIKITDGKGQIAEASLMNADPKACTFRIVNQTSAPAKNFSVHLAIAPTKNADRIEWMVEKCVEIGVETISFIQCKTSERKSINMERIEKITINAMKQSQHYWLPKLNAMLPLEQFIRQSNEHSKFIAHVDDKNPDHLKSLAKPGSNYLILIGPEGDFTSTELESARSAGFQKVSLGPNRLRTETAGLTAVMILNLINTQ